MQEITKVYPDYLEEMLPVDLLIKRKELKAKKIKLRNDFRARQLAKYDIAYHTTDSSSREFNRICERIASLTHADIKRYPIQLVVTLNGEKHLYTFPWITGEREIKEFHLLANKAEMTHEQLCQYRIDTSIKLQMISLCLYILVSLCNDIFIFIYIYIMVVILS